MNIGFVGLGKLGLPCAEVFAGHYPTFGYDPAKTESDSVTLCQSVKETVNASDVIFVAVQTPHDEMYDGSCPSSHLPPKDFDYSRLHDVVEEIARYATPEKTVVVISTVLPGTIRRQIAPLLKTGRLVYNPYLIAMGTVKNDMVNPEMLILGCDRGDGPEIERLKALYAPLMKNDPRIVAGTYEEAESIKIFYNTFISAKLSLVNMIQDVAQKLGHMDTDIVTRALAESTHRIMSPMYMKAGMGDGGPCHPRDNIALRYLARELDLGYDLFDAIMKSREVQAENLAAFLNGFGLPIVILGESYKPGVPFTDGSYARLVGHYASQRGNAPRYDNPVPDAPACYLLGHDIPYELSAVAPGSVVVDPWRKYTDPRPDITVVHYGNTRPTAR